MKVILYLKKIFLLKFGVPKFYCVTVFLHVALVSFRELLITSKSRPVDQIQPGTGE